MKDLQGKVALITGGATGIGKALALELAKESMKIIIASTNKERLDAAAEQIRKAGASEVLTTVCDVSDRKSVENLHAEAVKAFGFVDLLVCNSGVTTGGEFVDHRPTDWSWVYDVVLNGVVHCVQLFYPDMVKKKSGHIVIVGSQAGMVPDWVTLHGPYTVSGTQYLAEFMADKAYSKVCKIGSDGPWSRLAT